MEITFRRDLFDTDAEHRALVDLQNIVYKERGLHYELDEFKFWYNENPEGKVISVNAYDGDKMVCHYACIPYSWVLEGERVKGALSISVATHPDYRGKGLFVKTAKIAYDIARDEGIKFVMGVANANSIHGLTKHLGHKFIAQLDVKWGWGDVVLPSGEDMAHRYYDKDILNWRLGKKMYSQHGEYAYGMHSINFGIKTLMGKFNKNLLQQIDTPDSLNLIRPMNLYVGLGADLSKGHYFDFPKFVKHSPFNLHILDLTDGQLPELTKENLYFQLIDFDVA